MQGVQEESGEELEWGGMSGDRKGKRADKVKIKRFEIIVAY